MLRSLSLVAFLLSVPSVDAAAIDAVTLTPSGTDTTFTITGVYPSGTPETAFSSAGDPYSLTFTLPTTPTFFAIMDPNLDLFGLETSVLVNGTTFDNSMVIFFPESFEGGAGFVACLGAPCNPDPNILPYPAANFWDIAGTVYSGSASNPTFLEGAVNFDPQVSRGLVITGPAAAVPEPSSVFLLVTGLLVLGTISRRKSGFDER